MDGEHLEAAYKRHMAGVGPSFRERQRERVRCPEYVAYLTAELLATHRQDQHVTGQGPQWDNTPVPLEPRLYMVSFTKVDGMVGSPVKVCRGRMTTRTNLRIHFVHRHMWDTIVILEEGNRTPPSDIPVTCLCPGGT